MLVLMLPRVSSRVWFFPAASPCLWGKLQNLSFSKVSKQVVMSFCVADAALCDIPTCLITCRRLFCVAGAIFALFSQDELQFYNRSTFETLSSFSVAGAALQSCRIACSTLYNLHSALHPLHFTLSTLHSALYTPHSTLHTPHSTLYTLQSTLSTLRSTLHTSHHTLRTPHYTLHFTIHTLHFTLYT